MPEQQKDVQTQKQKGPPNLGGADKDAAGKPGFKQDPKKTGAKADDEDSESSCGTGSCG